MPSKNYPNLAGTQNETFSVGPKGTLQVFLVDPTTLSALTTWVIPDNPGVSGYFLKNDGVGGLSWDAVGAATDSTTPYYIPVGDTFTNHIYKQSLFNVPITIDGTLVVDGLLVEVD